MATTAELRADVQDVSVVVDSIATDVTRIGDLVQSLRDALNRQGGVMSQADLDEIDADVKDVRDRAQVALQRENQVQ